jgi:hypothetical protein
MKKRRTDFGCKALTGVLAERAYGPETIRRLRYADLVNLSETAIRPLLDFLEEPYTAKCLDPLERRINSSKVPPDFKSDDPATDPAVVEEATRLSRHLEEHSQPAEASRAAADEMDAAFAKRVQYMATLDDHYQRALQIIQKLQQTKMSAVAIPPGHTRADPPVLCLMHLSVAFTSYSVEISSYCADRRVIPHT